ncbi:hypothetical protein C9J12_11785 [Photobacterium frigidiphilum]|uniref:Uncharacterized protein n=1 Tax=Photobacterium frigidiphilum TaxID=264736 RepID=A0A2T3JH92_9GAMM|nr:hypothetical protein [Photobacterium frigidiphilum]PSU48291.1 hypothetical protein C9J12_11785 [Photobacterium frigidiphilum]
MELPATVFVAIGAILAALISGLFTFTNILISKEQKTSEFRQDWINEVRGEVSKFTYSVGSFTSHLVSRKGNLDDVTKFIDDNLELMNELSRSYNSIRLHLNKEDDKKIVDVLDDLYSFAARGTIDYTVADITKKENELISLTQDMLKAEWVRVKSGEKMFQATKWLGLFLFLSPIAFVAINYNAIVVYLSSIKI